MDYKIKLLTGYGELPFGMSLSDVENHLGKADYIEDLEGMEINEEVKMIAYEEHKTTLFFELSNGDYFLKSCDVEHKNLELFGVKVFELSEEELIKLFEEKNFTKYQIEEEEWGQKRISFTDTLSDFYFHEGKLESVTWGINYIEN